MCYKHEWCGASEMRDEELSLWCLLHQSFHEAYHICFSFRQPSNAGLTRAVQDLMGQDLPESLSLSDRLCVVIVD